MNIDWKGLLNAAVTKVRKAPVAKWIKPLWKGGLKAVVRSEGDKLEAELLKIAAAKGPGAIDDAVDAAQRKLQAAVDVLPLPAALEQKVKDKIQQRGDELQETAKTAFINGGADALKAACDRAQQALLDAIERL